MRPEPSAMRSTPTASLPLWALVRVCLDSALPEDPRRRRRRRRAYTTGGLSPLSRS